MNPKVINDVMSTHSISRVRPNSLHKRTLLRSNSPDRRTWGQLFVKDKVRFIRGLELVNSDQHEGCDKVIICQSEEGGDHKMAWRMPM